MPTNTLSCYQPFINAVSHQFAILKVGLESNFPPTVYLCHGAKDVCKYASNAGGKDSSRIRNSVFLV